MRADLQKAIERVARIDEERARACRDALDTMAAVDPALAKLALSVFDDNREKAAGWLCSRPSVFGGRMPLEMFTSERDWVVQVLYQIDYGMLA